MATGSTGRTRDPRERVLEEHEACLVRFATARTSDADLAQNLSQRARSKLTETPTLEGMSEAGTAAKHEISLSAVEKHLQRVYRQVVAIRERLDAGLDA